MARTRFFMAARFIFILLWAALFITAHAARAQIAPKLPPQPPDEGSLPPIIGTTDDDIFFDLPEDTPPIVPTQPKSDDPFFFEEDEIAVSDDFLFAPPGDMPPSVTAPFEEPPPTLPSPAVSDIRAITAYDDIIDHGFSQRLPLGEQAPVIREVLRTTRLIPPYARGRMLIHTQYNHERHFTRFHVGYFAAPNVLAVNEQYFYLPDWRLTFQPDPARTIRVPKFGLRHSGIQYLIIDFRSGDTTIFQCVSDFNRRDENAPCRVRADMSRTDLRAVITAITAEGVTYVIDVDLTDGLNAVYEGAFDTDDLSSVTLSHFPYTVEFIRPQEWFSFVTPLNDRFQLMMRFGNASAHINIAASELVPNYRRIAPLKEELFEVPPNFPFEPEIIYPRTNTEMPVRFFVDIGLRYLIGTRLPIKNAVLFPTVHGRFSAMLRHFEHASLYTSFEKSFTNTGGTSQLFSYEGFDFQMRLHYPFHTVFLRPKPILGMGYFAINVQSRSLINPAYTRTFLRHVSGVSGFVGVDLSLSRNFALNLGSLIAITRSPNWVNWFLRPEVGVFYHFTAALGIQLHWQWSIWKQAPDPVSGAKRGFIHDIGLMIQYNI